jgi:protein-tyrosine phosphatase
MIDLHSHILPGMDDGSKSLEMSFEMARAYVDQGVKYVACTPHILPGLYKNSGPQIKFATKRFQKELDESSIPLRLLSGADNHIVPGFVESLRSGHLLAIGSTRYVLVEPPHHVAPAQLERLFFEILAGAYIPILTHPERLKWIGNAYDKMQRLVERGVWMQVTSGSLLGRFGRDARYWAERMLDEDLIHILATDAHDNASRPPDLQKARMIVEKRLGPHKAAHLIDVHPMIVLCNKTLRDCVLCQRQGTYEPHRGKENYVQINNAVSGGGFVERLRQFFCREF